MKDKNYYELLEIDRNASKEIIEKAYKTLVKKYHPDIQSDISDELIKKINEAYEVISDPEKKEAYNASLCQNQISIEEYNRLNLENKLLQKQNTELASKLESIINSNIGSMPKTQSDIIQESKPYNPSIYKKNNYYNSEYEPSSDNSFYKSTIRSYANHYNMQDHSPIKNFLSFFITVLLVIVISFILWNIPFTKEYLVSLYESNEAIRTIVDLFI